MKKDVAIKGLLEKSVKLRELDKELRDDEEVVVTAVKISRHCFKYASDRLKDDGDFVLELVKYDARVMIYASNNLRDDWEFVLKVMDKHETQMTLLYSKMMLGKKQVIEQYGNTYNHYQQYPYIPFEFGNDRKKVYDCLKINAYRIDFARYKVLWELKNSLMSPLKEGLTSLGFIKYILFYGGTCEYIQFRGGGGYWSLNSKDWLLLKTDIRTEEDKEYLYKFLDEFIKNNPDYLDSVSKIFDDYK